jgi:hypothetical protein
MDRLIVQRTLTGCGLGLALILSGTGCRSMRSEVPPGRTYSGPGAPPPIEFSKSPNPATGPSALPGGGGAGQYGTPAPSTGLYGAPTSNGYGPPASAPGPAAGGGGGGSGGGGGGGGAPAQTPLQPPTQNPFSN